MLLNKLMLKIRNFRRWRPVTFWSIIVIAVGLVVSGIIFPEFGLTALMVIGGLTAFGLFIWWFLKILDENL